MRNAAMRAIPDGALPRLPVAPLTKATPRVRTERWHSTLLPFSRHRLAARRAALAGDGWAKMPEAAAIDRHLPLVRPTPTKRRSPGKTRASGAPAAGLEPATRRLTGGRSVAQGESLRHPGSLEEGEGAHPDPPCFTVLHDDSSRNVTGKCVECTECRRSFRVVLDEARSWPSTSEDALRLAIKLAVDAGECHRAALLLEVLRRLAR
jgi:hypothetical protein